MGTKATTNQGGPEIELLRAILGSVQLEIAEANKAISIVIDASGIVLTSSEVEDIKARRELGIKLS